MLPITLTSALLVAALCHAAATDSISSFEVDLVFPRNDTYTPMVYLPIIFAIQNAPFVWDMGVTVS
ncbi:uncharacterized protein BJX67DRAFT_347239 [Aspergillus lucknowensis]|uniref:DUF7136 domain-containing protein n=1 Tax=Aspergillus lucknowensis TaxID=176173 RepID=A0ABR4LZF9_9EURO